MGVEAPTPPGMVAAMSPEQRALYFRRCARRAKGDIAFLWFLIVVGVTGDIALFLMFIASNRALQ